MEKSFSEIKGRILVWFIFLGLVSLLFVMEYTTSCGVSGLVPRSFDHVFGFFLSPYLHCDLSHFLSNIIPLSILSGMLLAHMSAIGFVSVSLFIGFVSGLFVWFIGSDGQHLGSSGLIFGFVGFLLARMIFHRSFVSFLIGVPVFFMYGFLAFSLFSFAEGISWSGHAGGFLAGILLAKWERFLLPEVNSKENV